MQQAWQLLHLSPIDAKAGIRFGQAEQLFAQFSGVGDGSGILILFPRIEV
jgi:hypothetical protein